MLVTSSLSLFQGFNDNPNATPSNLADTFTHLNTGLNISVDSVRLQGQLSSSFDLYKYARATNEDTLDPGVLGFGLATVVPEHVFVDVRAAATQFSQVGGVAFENPTLIPPSQTTQSLITSVTPILRQSFKDLFDTEFRYSLGTTSFSNGSAFGLLGNNAGLAQPTALPSTALSDTTQSDAQFSIATGSRFNFVSSKLTLDATKVNSTSVAQSTQLQAIDVVQYQFDPRFSGLVNFGYENLRYPNQPAASTSGPLYSLGGRYASDDGTFATLNYGIQPGGINGFSGSGRYQVTSATGIFASIQQGLSSPQQQLLTNLNTSVLGANGTLVNQTTRLPSAIANPALSSAANNISQSEQLQLGADAVLDRDSFRILAFLTHQTAVGAPQPGLTPAAALLSGNDTTRGVSFAWSRLLTPDLTSGVSLGYSTDVAASNKTLTADLTLLHNFTETLSGLIHYNLSNQQTNLAGVSYYRNLFEIGLKKTF